MKIYTLILFLIISPGLPAYAAEREYTYVELEGVVEDYQYYHKWRAYYWREDFTILVRDDQGVQHRVISREPTPWTNLRLGTTYPKSKIDWKAKPRVKLIGVKAIDRTPAEFYDVKLDPKQTITAFIVRAKQTEKASWQDYYVNNWFHRWGKETNLKMLSHYANDDPHYTVYGYLRGIAAPFDSESQALLDKYAETYRGIIHHARVVKADNPVGFELSAIHFMGRNKKTLRYEVFFGDSSKLRPLDQKKPDE